MTPPSLDVLHETFDNAEGGVTHVLYRFVQTEGGGHSKYILSKDGVPALSSEPAILAYFPSVEAWIAHWLFASIGLTHERRGR